MDDSDSVRLVFKPPQESSEIIRRIEGMDRSIFYDCIPYPQPSKAFWWSVIDPDGWWVGFGGLKVLDRTTGYLCRAGIYPQQRGKGLQRRLIQARLRYAKRSLGLSCVITDTSPQNSASANNLFRCGFKVYNPANAWSGRSALYFRKDF